MPGRGTQVSLLTQTSKMPCKSWSIPADSCRMGSKLAQRKGTVCSKCYARKGFYRFGGVHHSQVERLKEWQRDRASWRESMVSALSTPKMISNGYFRWFDSGDLQGQEMLDDIIEVCKRTPHLSHRLPTKEYGLIAVLDPKRVPSNLCIQVSASTIDDLHMKDFYGYPVCSVTTRPELATCPAHLQGNKCLECRACWDSKTASVTYLLH